LFVKSRERRLLGVDGREHGSEIEQ
jgi:hypothetical protein